MGRKRSEYVCPKCSKTGSLERKPTSYDRVGKPRNSYRYVIHYENSKRTRCYIDDILRKKEKEEILKEISIPDDEFKHLLDTKHTHPIPWIRRYNLTLEQLNKLSHAEKQEYFYERGRYISQNAANKNKNKIQRIELDRLREISGIKSKEEQSKVSALKPPPEYWGESKTRSLFLNLSRELDIISKCLFKPIWDNPTYRTLQIQISKQFKTLSKFMNKNAKLVYYFKPSSKETDEGMYRIYQKWYEKYVRSICVILNLMGLQTDSNYASYNPEAIKNNILKERIDLKLQFELISDVLGMLLTYWKYIVDERYLLPFSRWKKIYGDRYNNFTIRGAAEINYLLTGEYVYGLKTNQEEIDNARSKGKTIPEKRYIVTRTPVKTTLSAKHVEKMTAIGGPVFQDIVRELRGTKAAIIMGLVEGDDKQIRTLSDLIFKFLYLERYFS